MRGIQAWGLVKTFFYTIHNMLPTFNCECKGSTTRMEPWISASNKIIHKQQKCINRLFSQQTECQRSTLIKILMFKSYDRNGMKELSEKGRPKINRTH